VELSGLLASRTFVIFRASAIHCIKLPEQKLELLPIIGVLLVTKVEALVAAGIDSNIPIAVDVFQKLAPAVATEVVAAVMIPVDYS
jgi:hypothetical protein